MKQVNERLVIFITYDPSDCIPSWVTYLQPHKGIDKGNKINDPEGYLKDRGFNSFITRRFAYFYYPNEITHLYRVDSLDPSKEIERLTVPKEIETCRDLEAVEGRYLFAAKWSPDRKRNSVFRIDEAYIHTGMFQEILLKVNLEKIDDPYKESAMRLR
mmetsp:Transcript_33637/g.51877  ORF Transcript_33637/g.51877 Transcript_33637/m.51877 type:complete len:158 (-) Transcript_33637:398-871(-)